MKAIDTNVLVRLLTRDDPAQAEVAAAEMRSGEIFLSSTVLLETEWVLRHAYEFSPEQINHALGAVADLAGLHLEDRPAVRRALRWHGQGMDLADALHLAKAGTASELVTFDKRFARSARETRAKPPVRLLSS